MATFLTLCAMSMPQRIKVGPSFSRPPVGHAEGSLRPALLPLACRRFWGYHWDNFTFAPVSQRWDTRVCGRFLRSMVYRTPLSYAACLLLTLGTRTMSLPRTPDPRPVCFSILIPRERLELIVHDGGLMEKGPPCPRKVFFGTLSRSVAGHSVRGVFRREGHPKIEALIALAQHPDFRTLHSRISQLDRCVGPAWYELTRGRERPVHPLSRLELTAGDVWDSCFGHADTATFVTAETFVRDMCLTVDGDGAVAAFQVWFVMMAQLGVSVDLLEAIESQFLVRYTHEWNDGPLYDAVGSFQQSGLVATPALPMLFFHRNRVRFLEASVTMDIVALDLLGLFWGSEPFAFDGEWGALVGETPRAVATVRFGLLEKARAFLANSDVWKCTSVATLSEVEGVCGLARLNGHVCVCNTRSHQKGRV